jgi:hypothetical protein
MNVPKIILTKTPEHEMKKKKEFILHERILGRQCKSPGFVLFVQNGKVGSNIKVKVTQVGDRSAKATIIV